MIAVETGKSWEEEQREKEEERKRREQEAWEREQRELEMLQGKSPPVSGFNILASQGYHWPAKMGFQLKNRIL